MISFIKDIYHRYEEMINYLVIGVMTTIVSLVVKYALLFTILDAKNGLQLQISIIVSWVVAVIFAYVTNRKFVFKSKSEKILKEIVLFFSSRVVTLIMESIILWYFITYLKLDSDIYVIIWTVLSQAMVIIGNYILSKFFVFTKNKPKLFTDKEKWHLILLFILAFVISYFFPYTHDDWDWGSITGVERLEQGFANFNGRWVGNTLGMLLSRVRILRAFTISLTFVWIIILIKKIVNSENKSIPYIATTLLLLMPVRMFAQSFAWTVSFANYVIPAAIILLMIYVNRNIFENKMVEISNKWTVPFLLLGFVTALFMEHMTIYHILLSIFLVGYGIVKFKKVNLSNLFYLLGTFAGGILMFSNSGYRTLFGKGDGYRAIEDGNIFIRTIKTYFDIFKDLLVSNNFILNMVICILMLTLTYQFLKKYKKEISNWKKILLKAANTVLIIFIVYHCYLKMVGNVNLFIQNDIRRFLEGCLILAYAFSIITIVLIAVTDLKKKKRMLFEISSIVVVALPLLIVTPIGPRCFFVTYLLFVLLAIELFALVTEKAKIDLGWVFKISTYAITFFLFILYGYVFMIEQKRVNYIKNHKTEEILVLPKIPYESFMQHPNPSSKWFMRQFKQFYNIDSDVELEFIDYKEWKKEYEK